MRKRKIAQLLVSLLILVAAGWIVSYYVNTVGSLRAESGLSAQPVSEPFVHPDLTFDLTDEPFPAEGQYCLACHQGIEPARPIGSPLAI